MTRITTLIENSNGTHLGLESEHGLSFYIEKDASSILFDTGSGSFFIANAEKLDINIAGVDAVVVSHGHYDHSGGVMPYYACTQSRAPLIVGNGFFDRKYELEQGGQTYLGNAFNRQTVHKAGIRIVEIDGTDTSAELASFEAVPGIHVCTGFSRVTEYEKINPSYVVQRGESFVQDAFTDEVCIAVEISGGIAVLVGCAHPGIVNMLRSIEKKFGSCIKAVFGGIHLSGADSHRLTASMEYLNGLSLEKLGIAHCSGEQAVSMASKNPSVFYRNRSGTSVVLA